MPAGKTINTLPGAGALPFQPAGGRRQDRGGAAGDDDGRLLFALKLLTSPFKNMGGGNESGSGGTEGERGRE